MRKKKKPPRKVEDQLETASTASPEINTPATTPIFMLKSVTAAIPAHIMEHPVLTTTKAKKKAKAKPVTPEDSNEESIKPKKKKKQRGRSSQEYVLRAI